MNIEVIEGVTTLNLDMIATTALAGVLLLLGYGIRKRLTILERLCIPAPVIGGLLCALVVWGLKDSHILAIKMDTTLQLPFMLAFFICVGFGGSFKLLKTGGRYLLVFLGACWLLAICQNIIGVGFASMLGVHPVLGVMAGTVSLAGGHGNAAAFGPVAENLGVTGATTVAVAAATFGLVAGSLVGGPVGNYLINKYHIKIKADEVAAQSTDATTVQEPAVIPIDFVRHLVFVFVFMFGGMFLSNVVKGWQIQGLAIPSYVGGMFLAIVFRNINDKHQVVKLDFRVLDIILEVGLGFFLAMATMTLKVWELVDIAGPLFIILIAQFIFLILFGVFVVFPMLGKDYDGAVMTGGYVGWGLGIAATAVVCMSAVCEKFGLRSSKAFLIVPLCGAVFVDLVAVPSIIFFITTFAK